MVIQVNSETRRDWSPTLTVSGFKTSELPMLYVLDIGEGGNKFEGAAEAVPGRGLPDSAGR